MKLDYPHHCSISLSNYDAEGALFNLGVLTVLATHALGPEYEKWKWHAEGTTIIVSFINKADMYVFMNVVGYEALTSQADQAGSHQS